MALAAPVMSDEAVYDLLRRHAPASVVGYLTSTAREQEEEGNARLAEQFRRQCATMIGFTEYRYARYVTAPHHKLVSEQLERVERREIDRLIIEMPPRHGKSELASKSYPSWCLGRNPTKQIISASAANDLAQDWGKWVRNIVASDEFRLVYPGVELAEDSRAAGKWQTKQGGIYVAASVGTAILGRGADEYLIDDAFGSMQDARSETIRNSVWEWYNGTVYNRLQPGGAIIIIGHRMHEDDLAGRLIERMKAGDGADQWTIIRLPAIAEAPTKEYPEPDPLGRKPGEALWPASYPIKALERIRANTQPPRNWFALYQQRPTPDEGAMFMPDKITIRKNSNTSDVVVWVRAWDLAASVDGDWTVGVQMGRTSSGKIVIGHVRRLRGRPEAVSEAIAAQARLDTIRVKIALPIDPGQAGLAQKSAFVKLLNGFRVDFSPESGDKETRAEPFAVQVNNDNVEMMEGDWNAAYVEELRSFPDGKYKDQVDASSRAHMVLMASGMPIRINPALLER